MILNFTRQWLRDPRSLVDQLRSIFREHAELSLPEKHYETGETIISEGEVNDAVHIINEGYIELLKTDAKNKTVKVDHLGPGSMTGLVSFCTGNEALTTARTSSPCSILRIDDELFNQLAHDHPDVTSIFLQLVIGNMLDRYHHIVKVHLELESMNDQLQQERNQLQEALQQLEDTQQQLVYREKMATLGQLVAGVAHELNNPASSLSRAGDNLRTTLQELIQSDILIPRNLAIDFFEAGCHASFYDTKDRRLQISELSRLFPDISRTLQRRLSSIPKELLGQLKTMLPEHRSERKKWFEKAVQFYEAGWFLHITSTSTRRITDIVKSLKNFSRHDKTEFRNSDLLEGLNDTLLLLNNRLKKVDLTLDLQELPEVSCIPGEINQVWTNIIVNACEAIDESGKIHISTGVIENYAWVGFEDNGPGIPKELTQRIFDANFTTKTKGGDFGLGIGLAIAKDTILKHGGNIVVEDSDLGGARFIVYLPVAKRKEQASAKV